MPYQAIEREISPILFTTLPPHKLQLKRDKLDTKQFSQSRQCHTQTGYHLTYNLPQFELGTDFTVFRG